MYLKAVLFGWSVGDWPFSAAPSVDNDHVQQKDNNRPEISPGVSGLSPPLTALWVNRKSHCRKIQRSLPPSLLLLVRWIVQANVKILSLLTHPPVISKQSDFSSFAEHEKVIFLLRWKWMGSDIKASIKRSRVVFKSPMAAFSEEQIEM